MHAWHSASYLASYLLCLHMHLQSYRVSRLALTLLYSHLRCLQRQARHRIVLACFLATFTAYVERVGFSIAFTTMAKQAGLSEALKGTVLSAFFWGYAVSQARPATPTSSRLMSTVTTGRTCHYEAALSSRAHCNQVGCARAPGLLSVGR